MLLTILSEQFTTKGKFNPMFKVLFANLMVLVVIYTIMPIYIFIFLRVDLLFYFPFQKKKEKKVVVEKFAIIMSNVQ
jgi:hypothetical protein